MSIRRDPVPDGIFATADAVALHREIVVFDCLSLQYQLDPPYVERAIEGGVTATNMTVATENETWDTVMQTVESTLEKVAAHPDMVLATTATDIRAAKRAGKLAVVMGLQGSESLHKSLYRVGLLHRLGVRFIGLAYTGATMFGDGCGEARNAGLTFLGKDFVAAVNELPMLLDLSHSGHQTRLEAAELALHPVCTHSNAYAINPNDRNTKDEVARVVGAKGGVMGICGLERSVWPDHPTVEHLVDHAEYYLGLLGAAHVGIGMDYTEGYQDSYCAGVPVKQSHKWRTWRPDIFGTLDDFYTKPYPRGVEAITKLPNLTQTLLDRGHSHATVTDIMGGAWLRCMDAVTG